MPPGPTDAAADAVPDAGPCQTLGATCAGDMLRTCSAMGQPPVETTCAWGCSNNACSELSPSGGWETQSTGDTTDFSGLSDITIPAGAIVNTDDGSITGANATGTFRAAGTGVVSGIDFQTRAIGNTGRMAAVFRGTRLTMGNVQLVGANAVVFVADEGIEIAGIVTGVPACGFSDVRTPGPGGFMGGLNDVDGLPTPPGGGGVHGDNDDIGGGGGGYGGFGGAGGNNLLSGGATRGDAEISLLLGGSGGGGGDDHANSGRGGGGGAAIHLVANGPITIMSGGINAGGCGGRAGTGGNDGGGGGGSGGAILIEGTTVAIGGTLAVNGGGGGGGNTGANTTGQAGQLSRTPALGGAAGGGSRGGAGAAGALFLAESGTNDSGGGGGGGLGRIRINSRTGSVDRANATLSPGPNDLGTTYSEAAATLR